MASGPDLARPGTVLVVDWPSRDVPESLARAGWTVVVHGGPGPDDYAAYELVGEEVVARQVGRPPDRADLVYSHRPIVELGAIAATAKALGASAVWVQSGTGEDGSPDPRGCWMADDDAREARRIVETAGLRYVDRPYIGDAVGGQDRWPAGSA